MKTMYTFSMMRRLIVLSFWCVLISLMSCNTAFDASFTESEDMSDGNISSESNETSFTEDSGKDLPLINQDDVGKHLTPDENYTAKLFINPLSKNFVDKQVASMSASVGHQWWRGKIGDDELIDSRDRQNMLFLYDKLVENATNILTNQSWDISLPEGETLSFLQIRDTYDAVILDYPQLFWLGNRYNGSFLNSDTNKYYKITLKPSCLANTDEEALSILQSIEKKVTEIISSLDLTKPSSEILKDLYDKVSGVPFADVSTNSQLYDWRIHCLYGALILNETVCDGYSAAYSYIIKKIQMEKACLLDVFCTVIMGKPYLHGKYPNHAWNLVNMLGENKWYETDLTGKSYFHVPGNYSDIGFIRGHMLDADHISSRYVPSAKFRFYRYWENSPMGYNPPKINKFEEYWKNFPL